MAQVFISHSSADKEQTRAVVKYLEARNISCWVSYRNIPPGADFADVIPPAIRECPAFVILISQNSVASKDVANELTLAARKVGQTGKMILPLMLEDISLPDKFDYHLASSQTYRHYIDPDAALGKIFRELRKVLPDEGPLPQLDDATAEDCYQIAERKYKEGDFEAAATWYKQAVELLREQLPQAAQPVQDSALEEWYQKGLEYYLTDNYIEAVEWFCRAADWGHARAQFRMGICYDWGYGVFKDEKTAAMWYQKAAEQGYADAQRNLGHCYRHGVGVTRDDKTAVMWYQKAANQGHAKAQYNLGVCYDEGYGVSQDSETAVMWYQKAADQGHAGAQYELGFCYEYGRGLKKNLIEAKKWYQKAADQGDEDARKALERLK